MRRRIWLSVVLGLITAAAAGWLLRRRLRPSLATGDAADLVARTSDIADAEARWEDEGGAFRLDDQL